MFPKYTFRDFNKERYLAVVKAFPHSNTHRTQAYFYLILTFLSLSLLGIFAINPTLVTVFELNKKVEDSTYLKESLELKKNNLSALYTQYELLQNDIPVIEAAVPKYPQNAYILAQMQKIASDTGVSIVGIQGNEVELSKSFKTDATDASYTFTVSARGEIQQLMQFMQSVTRFERVVSVEKIEMITAENTKILSIRIRTYFMP